MKYFDCFHLITSPALGTAESCLGIIGSLNNGKGLGQASINLFANASTGNLVLRGHSKTIIDNGFELPIHMLYNSQSNNWRLSLIKKLEAEQNAIIITQEDGCKIRFTYDDDTQTYTAVGLANGNQRITPLNDGSWGLFHFKTGVTETFNADGQLIMRTDAQGRRLQYTYENDRLTRINCPSGQAIIIDYDANSRITVLSSL